MISYILYMVSCIINMILPLEGFFKLHKTKKDYLLRGGFLFFNALNLASWLIYGFLSQKLHYSNPIFLGTALFYLLISLIMFKEYANIVYHNVIIINYSWWVRQQNLDVVLKMSLLTSSLFLIIPNLGMLYYCLRKKNLAYVSYSQIIGHLISAFSYLAFCLIQRFWLLALMSVFKIGILAGQVLVRKKLERIEKSKEKIKKSE